MGNMGKTLLFLFWAISAVIFVLSVIWQAVKYLLR